MENKPKWPYELFGIECDKGWEKLYIPLFEVCKQNNVKVLQCKEKFGTLRFYTAGGPEWVQDLIQIVENYSSKVCELCGAQHNYYPEWNGEHQKPHKVQTNHTGWHRTLCTKCRGYDLDKKADLSETPV